MTDFKDIMQQLAQPFPADIIDWKPSATTKDKTKALGAAYVEVRYYIARLNEVVGEHWHDEYQFMSADGRLVACGLTINGVTRWDIGEQSANDENTATAAIAQAFKRACVKFGLGAHLYHMESAWVPYDAQRKRFTDDGLRKLRNLASRELGGNTRPSPTTAPAPQAEVDPADGNGRPLEDLPANPKALLTYVNERTEVPYDNIFALRGALAKEGLEGKSWPDMGKDQEWVIQAIDKAIAHAQAKLAKAA